MNKKKLIILLDQPLDDRNLKRFGINFYINNNWKIECWNFINITNRNINIKKKPEIIQNYKEFKQYEFDNYLSFILLATKLFKSFYYVNFSSDRFGMTLIQNIMCLKGGKKVYISVGTIPELKVSLTRINKLYNLLKSFQISKIVSIFINYLSKKLLTPKIDFAFVSGKEELKVIEKKNDTKIYYTHNLDYDIYIKHKSNPPKKKLIVFIDQNVPNHPDWEANNLVSPVTYEKYWKSVKNLLFFLSQNYSEKIIISGHPRNKDTDIPIEDYEILYEKTAEKIKDALFIIGHDSTALQFAVLWNKPILFVTTNELEVNRKNKIEFFSSILGYKKVVNIDRDYDKSFLEKAMQINKQSYADYIESYIKLKNSPMTYSWEIINKNLK